VVNDTTNQESAEDKTTPAETPSANAAASASAAGAIKESGNTPATAHAKVGASAAKPNVSKWRAIKIVFLLLLLVIAAGAAFFGWRHLGDGLGPQLGTVITGQQSSANAAPPVVELTRAPVESTVSPGLVGSVEDLTARSGRQEESLRKLENLLADLQLQSQSQQQRIRELTTTTREDWLLAEAEYLLRLANQRILTEKQGKNALSLMETVDAILKELDAPDLFPVRKALASDITQLRLAGEVDREGIYLQLEALIDGIAQLDIPMVAVTETREEASAEQPWYATLADNAWRALKKLSGIIRVERVDEMVAPRLLPSQQDLLRLNLRLALEQAQLGLLREEQAIYQASLQSAEEIVAAKFAGDEQAQMVLDQLADLATKQVVQDLPSASASITALQDYIALWHDRFPVEEDSEPAPAAEPAPPVDGDQP
jgi:uroporphyrin-III C-methyltransferase